MSAPTTALDAPRVGATVLDTLSVPSAMEGTNEGPLRIA